WCRCGSRPRGRGRRTRSRKGESGTDQEVECNTIKQGRGEFAGEPLAPRKMKPRTSDYAARPCSSKLTLVVSEYNRLMVKGLHEGAKHLDIRTTRRIITS